MFCRVIYILCILFVLINFEVLSQVSYQQILSQGLRFQIQADSLQRLVSTQTAALSTAPQSRVISIMLSIRDNDARAVELQKLANERFAQAERAFEKPSANILPEINEFAIIARSPYSAANPIPIDVPLPVGVAYKIQLGAFSRQLPANSFRGLTPVSGEKLENGVVKYYVGLFSLHSDADDALKKVREYGFTEAFIVAF